MKAALGAGIASLVCLALWLAVVLWQFHHPDQLPSIAGDTLPAIGALLLGVAAALSGAILGIRGHGRRAWFAASLGSLAVLGPLTITAQAFRTFNDWNFSNRAFIATLFPAIAAWQDRSLSQVTVLPHFVVYHAHPLPTWEEYRIERQWARLHVLLGTAPAGRIVVYLNDADPQSPIDAAYGRLVFARAMSERTGCATLLHEIAHAFLYARSKGNTFPQLLDEGWARANQGCARRELDYRVEVDREQGLMPPLEDRLTAEDFARPAYGGTATGYDAAGSFVAWLLGNLGVHRFIWLVDRATAQSLTRDARVVYGRPFHQLESRWLHDIDVEFRRG